MPICLVLVDDHALVRAGLKALLQAQPHLQVIGEASGAEELLHLLAERRPDLVLMDVSLPGSDGLELTQQVLQRYPEVKVLVLTMHEDESYLVRAIKAGASGYVLKKAADTELLNAINTVYSGGTVVPPSLAVNLIREFYNKPGEKETTSVEVLSERETEVLRLIAVGYSNQEIAESLFLSIKTVETHKARIMEKLNLKKRSELVRYAMSKNLIPGSDKSKG
ncbi:MAG: response regulator transcription factor [Firmicutes bacterium]|nr:response regulator transcription factor [Bacillota bacterium]